MSKKKKRRFCNYTPPGKKMQSFKTACPLCNSILTLQNFDDHRIQFHRNLSHWKFERIVIEAIKSGKIIAKYFEGTNSSLSSSSKKISNKIGRYKNGFSHMVQGGRTSPR